MARETKAQRLEREAAARQAHEAEQENTYPARLLAVLERATKVNFELKVVDLDFRLKDLDDSDSDAFFLTYDYTLSSNATLETLEQNVYWKEEEQAESNRKYAMKKSALAKLSNEEKEVLGLL